MKINSKNINTKKYWDEHIAEPEFGLRQKKYLKLAGTGGRIVELGCGCSPFLYKARKNFKEAHGLDFSLKTLKLARNKFPNVFYIIGDAISTPYYDKEFDVSVAGELIEHLKEPEKLIAEMMRITKRRIIISTARMEYNDTEHIWEFTSEDLKEIGDKYGKTNVEEIKSERFPGRSYLFLTIDL
jgi:ubiquinone/menaquinone biosynthesis C-methylase UbiE